MIGMGRRRGGNGHCLLGARRRSSARRRREARQHAHKQYNSKQRGKRQEDSVGERTRQFMQRSIMEGGDAERRPAASRPTRFGGLVRQASASFNRGGSGRSSSKDKQSPPEKSNRKSNLVSAGKRLAVPGLTSSLSSQDGEERTGPLYELGSRMKAALKSRRSKGGSTAAELQTNRRLSRRTRNSEGIIRRLSLSTEHLPQAQAEGDIKPSSGPTSYLQLRKANMLSQRSESSASAADNLLISSKLLEARRKDNFCDVEIAGKDGVAVKAPSFLLACHSAVFEEIFYPKDGAENASHPFVSKSDPRKIHVEFASQSAIEAVVHFCATLELPIELESRTSSDEAGIRTICQVNLLGHLFKMASLSNAAYRAARCMMNTNPHLVCAAFDEIILLLARAESENNWGLAFDANQDELRTYTQEFLRESPADTMMGLNGQELGVAFLSPLSIEAIVCDEALDVDEYTVWRILNLWVSRGPGPNTDRLEKARAVMAHIQLVLVDPKHLKHQVRKCAYVNPEDIEKALEEIESILEKETPDDKERVIVEGAGEDRVNGIYILAEDDIGITRDEVLFIKEGDAGEGCQCTDFGLHLWGEQWGISKCTDYFEPLYTCELSRWKGHTHRRPPKWGWKCASGAEPAPTCTWKPSKEEEGRDSSDTKFAPALIEVKVDKNGSTNDVHSSCGHRLKQSLTLSQMMALPEDIGSSNKSLFEYAPAAKDLDAMMDLSVDEGHDDEEGGYDVSYMSAHLFYDPSKRSLKDDKDVDSKQPS